MAAFPDFTPLYEAAKDLGEQMVLDFRGTVGAHVYARWTGDGWEVKSVGPWESKKDGGYVISSKDCEVTDAEVKELVETTLIIHLVWYTETPFDGHDDWEYTNEENGNRT